MRNINRIDIDQMERRYRANFINSLLGFKYLHLVATINSEGVNNLALFNSVFHIGANPPLLGMVVRPVKPENDTLNNIKATGQYTLNNVLPQWYQRAHQASAKYPSGFSEFAACGLNEQYIAGVKAPFVQQSTIKIALDAREFKPVELNGTTIVIGEIKTVILEDEFIQQDGNIDQLKAGTITVAGLDTYFTTQKLGQLPYAKPGQEPGSDKSDVLPVNV